MDYFQVINVCDFKYENQHCKKTVKQIKKKNFFLSFCVGVIVGVSALYIVQTLNNIIEKKPLNEAAQVTGTWQDYYAAAIAGGINGLLVLMLPPVLYSFAAVIVIAFTYQIIAGLSGLDTLNNLELVQALVRDIFLVILILYLIQLFTGKDLDEEDSFGNDIGILTELEFDELLEVTFVSSIVLNISLSQTSPFINKFFGFRSPSQAVIPSDVLA